jgi:hypothetical protein
VLFATSAVLQFNDPDPLPWVAVYGAAAGLAWCAARARPQPVLALLLCTVAGAWALALAMRVNGPVPLPELFSFGMARPSVELAREIAGLGLVVLWLATTSVRALRDRGQVRHLLSR